MTILLKEKMEGIKKKLALMTKTDLQNIKKSITETLTEKKQVLRDAKDLAASHEFRNHSVFLL
jgi:hypothetical protein